MKVSVPVQVKDPEMAEWKGVPLVDNFTITSEFTRKHSQEKGSALLFFEVTAVRFDAEAHGIKQVNDLVHF